MPSPDCWIPASLIDAACSRWNGCSQSGSWSPSLTSASGGEITVVIYHEGTSPDEYCGETLDTLGPNQAIIGAEVWLYDQTPGGIQCVPVRERTLAHELGHVQGLADATYANCNTPYSYLMGPFGGAENPQSDECTMVDIQWYTPCEQDLVNQWSCEQYCQGTCVQEQGQWVCHDGQPSPIIIDLGGHGYRLTSVADGVWFDVYGDGTPRRTSWTGDGDEAFLCFDLDHNGRITSGRELFGNYTIPHRGTQAENGFVALGWYDRPEMGGNGDGWIGPSDLIWGLLRVWKDTNHDGISQSSEMISLNAAGIVGISTDYKQEGRRDAFGNLFRYRGTVLIREANGRVQGRSIYDIFLVSD